MSKDLFTRVLNRFKKAENPQVILLIADDALLTKIVVAWTNTPVAQARRPTPFRAKSDNTAWEWLWQNTRFSHEDVISRVPAADSRISQKIRSLIENRVLYPDGTANSYVDRYLRNTVAQLFEKRPKRALTKMM